MKLFDFQNQILDETKDFNRVAYYLDMGLGKTFVGGEKLIRLGADMSLVVCPKSKVSDWCDHFKEHYPIHKVYDLTKKAQYESFINQEDSGLCNHIGVINYDLLIRRPELKTLEDFTLMLDESQAIAYETSKRTKFILKLKPKNVVLLSGTPVGGKYEQLYSQLSLLGVKWTKNEFWNRHVVWRDFRPPNLPVFFPPIKIVTGYKDVDGLKLELKRHGAVFLKTDEVLTLPNQIFETVKIKTTPSYRKFKKDRLVEVDGKEFVGDTTFKKLLYERMLCGAYNPDKLTAFKDLIESTGDRIIVFYNFDSELDTLKKVIGNSRPISEINGHTKDLTAYENESNSITLIQYASGASGINAQLANRLIYFSLPLSSALFEQSKKRIHRIGSKSTCFYYQLICSNSVEEKILASLEQKRDYTDLLFEKDSL